jgi:uncharacterized protein (DUF433 family)
METVAYAHIDFRKDGQPIIAGKNFKIKHIALDLIAEGWNADEIQRQHPQLTLAEVHSALAYYYDHKEEMDKEIEEGYRYAEELRLQQGDSPLRRKLQEAKRQLT